MRLVGGILGLIGGVFGVFGAGATLICGGFGAPFEAEAEGSNTVIPALVCVPFLE